MSISKIESTSTESFYDTPQLGVRIKDEPKEVLEAKVSNRKRNVDEGI